MKILATLLISLAFTSCSYTISLVHTEGEATDVIDAICKPNADLDVTATRPAATVHSTVLH